MEAIYAEMRARNTAWLQDHPFAADGLLGSPDDARRCIALVGLGELRLTDAGSAAVRELESVAATAPLAWTRPRLHHTFCVLRPFRDDGYTGGELDDAVAACDRLRLPPAYTVVFDRIEAVPTGVVLCGTADADINACRERLRAEGAIQGERYKLDIAHATLLRCTAPPPPTHQRALVDCIVRLQSAAPRSVYATLDVRALGLHHADWCMRAGECRKKYELGKTDDRGDRLRAHHGDRL